MTRRRFASAAASIALVGAATGCLPLPTEVAASICPSQSTYVPASQTSAPLVGVPGIGDVPQPSAEILAKLAARPNPPRIRATPIVTALVGYTTGAADAAALRQEFGSAIDIEIGRKRLGGGPSGAVEPCLLDAPRWGIWGPTPRGISITTTISQPRVSRYGAGPSATVRVTNRTRRTIMVQADPSSYSAVLSAPLGALAVNSSYGVAAKDAPPDTPATPEFVRLPDAAASDPWALVLFNDSRYDPPKIAVRPGASTTVQVHASPISLQPGADPLLSPGRYDLRAPVNVYLSTAADAAPIMVAAPPASVELMDWQLVD